MMPCHLLSLFFKAFAVVHIFLVDRCLSFILCNTIGLNDLLLRIGSCHDPLAMSWHVKRQHNIYRG